MCSNNKILVCILVVAFFLRLSALTYGLPYSLFGDEFVHVAAAFRMMEEHLFRPNFSFYYLPPFFSYMLAPLFGFYGILGILAGKFHNIAEFRHFALLNSEYFLVFLRFLGAVFGVSSLAVFFALARKFFDEKFSLLATAILAFDFLHLQESVTGRLWAPVTFFILSGSYAVLKVCETGEKKWYFIAALAVGGGFGMGYVPLLILPFVWLAHFLRDAPVSFKEKLKHSFFWFANFISVFLVAVFSYANPHALIRQFGSSLATFLDYFGSSSKVMVPGVIFQEADFFSNLKEVVVNFRDLNPVLLFWAAAGLILFAIKVEPLFKKLLIVGMPLIYLLGISFVFSWIDHRYMLPAYPFLILAAVYALKELRQKTGAFWRIFATTAAAAILIFPLGLDFFYVRLLRKTDTVVQAREWIKTSLPEGARIISNIYLTNNQAGLNFIQKYGQKQMDSRSRYLLTLDEKNYPQPNFFVYNLEYLGPEIFAANPPADYLVYSFRDIKSREGFLAQLQYHRELIKNFYPLPVVTSIPSFYDNVPRPYSYFPHLQNLGPYVEIYKLY